MKSLRRSDDFNAEVLGEWIYLEQFGHDLADRFIDRIEETLLLLGREPGVGHPGRYRHPRLAGLRIRPVARPFRDWLIFYWDRKNHVDVFRLIHGSRDLPRRLIEPPSR